jgi:hypothetical protein
MDRYDSGESPEELPGEAMAPSMGTKPPRPERKRRKVSLIAAMVVNVVVVIVVAIILLVFLLPGYRRSYTMGRATKGADEVWVVVRTSEAQMRTNNTDFISAEDGLKNALQELVKAGGENVFAFVRDSFPDQGWISQYLPSDMQQWLQQLYPPPSPSPGSTGLQAGAAE